MKILIDTQCWLRCLLDPDLLNEASRDLLSEQRHPVYLSAASAWEIAIKATIGKLRLPQPPERYVPARLADLGMRGMPIEHAHALRVAALPAHHSDPFDRLLIAQAQVERCVLMTADAAILAYDVETVWAGTGTSPEPRPRKKRQRSRSE